MATKTITRFIRPHILEVPESASARLEPTGSLSGSQIYDAAGGSAYIPDWSLMPCPLGLVFDYISGGSDPSKVEPTQEELLGQTTGSWYYCDSDGVEKAINFATSTMFAAVSGNPHRIQVKNNITPDSSVTVIYRGTLTRNGKTMEIYASFPLRCRSGSLPQPRLDLDIPDTWLYNPIRDRRSVHTVRARLLQAGRVFQPGIDCAFYWEVWDGSAWIALDPNEVSGAEFNYNTIDRSAVDITLALLQDGTRVRCSAAWDTGDGVWAGSPEAAQAHGKTIGAGVKIPRYEFEVSRKCYKLDGIPIGIPLRYSDTSIQYHGEAEITEGGRVVDNPEEVLDIKWYLWTDTSNGQVKPSSSTLIGTGPEVTYKVPAGTEDYGLTLEIGMKEPLTVLMDGDGNVLTDDSGNWLIG